MASLRELMLRELMEKVDNNTLNEMHSDQCTCIQCGYTFDKEQTDMYDTDENGNMVCPECQSDEICCGDECDDGLNESVNPTTVEALETIIEMVENEILTIEETNVLTESISSIFDIILEKSDLTE
jgi:hypothetical protein